MEHKTEKTKRNGHRLGFGLIEVLVSSGIIAMVATSGIVLSNFIVHQSASFTSREVANWLASEGLEQVRVWRDTNLIDEDPTTDWLSLSVPTSSSSNTPDEKSSYTTKISASGRISLKVSTTGGEKITLNGVDYYRKIRIVNPYPTQSSGSGKHKALVTVTINWQDADVDKNLQMSEILTDFAKGVL